MKLWQYTELDDWQVIQADFNNYIQNKGFENLMSWEYILSNDFDKISKTLIPTLEKKGIKVLGMAILSFWPDQQPIHLDNDSPSDYRLNIPLLNSEHSITEYYKVDDSKKIIRNIESTNLETVYESWDEDGIIEKIDEFYLSQPTIINVLVPHRVKTSASLPPGQPRCSLTICPTDRAQLVKYL